MVATSDSTPPPFDDRPFVRLDHGMPENPKVVGLSDAAFRLYVEAICWCSRQETDGKIPAAMMRRLGRPKPLAELISAGLIDRDGKDFEVHDYLMFQRSKAEIEEFRTARSADGTKGNHKRWHVARRKFDPNCEHCVSDSPPRSGTRSPSRSLNDRYPIADTDTDADTAISSTSGPVVDGVEQASIVTFRTARPSDDLTLDRKIRGR